MNVVVRANRILKPMESYRGSNEIAASVINSLELKGNEECIGVYENIVGDLSDCIFITNIGLRFKSSGKKELIPFTKIKNILPPSNKTTDTTITIMLDSDNFTSIEIRNGRGRFKDVFEFVRFLDRVLKDIRCSRPNSDRIDSQIKTV